MLRRVKEARKYGMEGVVSRDLGCSCCPITLPFVGQQYVRPGDVTPPRQSRPSTTIVMVAG